MSYQIYKRYYGKFSRLLGYYEACDILAFKSKWIGFLKYKNLLKQSIKEAKNNNKSIIGADICCGEYAWLPRHFYREFKKIYCVDINPFVFERSNIFNKRNVIIIRKDISKKLNLRKESLDFLYCGYNMYEKFLENFITILKNGGQMFLMKPKDGDDFILRTKLKKYDMLKREKEINNITKFLKNYGISKYKEVLFRWEFDNANLNKILAALSVVSLGKSKLLSEKQYDTSIKFLENKMSKNNKLTLSQTCSIWNFKKT